MDLARRHRHRVDLRGDTFLVCTERAGSMIRVWIERGESPGTCWVNLTDGPALSEGGPCRHNDFALSEDLMPLAEEVAFSSGLFQRTGRSTEISQRALSIWSFSSASPLRIRGAGEPDTRPIHDPLGLNGKDIPVVMKHFADATRELQVTGIVVTGPEVSSENPDDRALVAATPDNLLGLKTQLVASGRRRLHPCSDWGMLSDAPYLGASTLQDLGYHAWVSVSTSLMDGHYYEVMMLGPAALAEPVRAGAAAVTALNMVSAVRRAAVASLKLSPRELEVLRIGPMGVKESAEALGLTMSTIKFHRENLRRKIGGDTTWQTYLRAQKLGVLD